jgi:hypothetical protein
MRHVQVARLTWALTGLFVAGAVLFATTRPATPPDADQAPLAGADSAATAFDAHCAACHGPREFPYWASLQPDQEQRRSWLDGFLQRHHPPPDEERARVIDHIERGIAEGG